MASVSKVRFQRNRLVYDTRLSRGRKWAALEAEMTYVARASGAYSQARRWEKNDRPETTEQGRERSKEAAKTAGCTTAVCPKGA